MDRTRRALAAALLGAVALPVAVTAHLVLLGYDPARLGTGGPPTAIYLVGLAAAGGAVGYASRRGHPVVAGGVLLYALAAPFDPLFAPRPDEHAAVLAFAADALFLGVVSCCWLVAAEALSDPALVESVAPAEVRRVALWVGTAHALAALVVRTGVFGFPAFGRGLFGLGLGLWLLGGAFVEGATPAVAYARYRLLTPALVVAGLFAVAAWTTWQTVRDPAAIAAAITPFTLYLVAWFVVVGLALLAGVLEYGVRDARRALR